MDYMKTSCICFNDNIVQNMYFNMYTYCDSFLQNEFFKQGEAEMSDVFLEKCFLHVRMLSAAGVRKHPFII